MSLQINLKDNENLIDADCRRRKKYKSLTQRRKAPIRTTSESKTRRHKSRKTFFFLVSLSSHFCCCCVVDMIEIASVGIADNQRIVRCPSHRCIENQTDRFLWAWLYILSRDCSIFNDLAMLAVRSGV